MTTGTNQSTTAPSTTAQAAVPSTDPRAPRRIGGREPGRAGLRRLGRRAVAMEVAGWRSIGRALFRRPPVPHGASAHRYDGPIRTILVVFLVISAIEVPMVDLLTHRWPAVRFPLLAVGLWGVTTMLGMLCGYVTRPHAVGPDGIIARSGAEIEVTLPWDDVTSVAHRRHALSGAPSASLIGPDDDQALNLVVQDGTNIDIQLEGPTTVGLPNGSVTVTRVRIAVDDATAFLDAVRRHIP
ncbi:hypothetical protein [Promicromonospora panici]|uniref:hypothetical protein n=1 Tax=Promicromonospora panici TaxID=2219658 RepID=UPI00101D6B19|nr:hypothetical protein [Promicromonospora panici]